MLSYLLPRETADDKSDRNTLFTIQLLAIVPSYPQVLDTGASEHICSDKTAFSTIQAYTTSQEYEQQTSGNKKVKANRHRTISLTLHLGDKKLHDKAIPPTCYQLRLHYIYKKGGQYNLFSLGTAAKQGIQQNSKTGALHKDDILISYTKIHQRILFLQLTSPTLGAVVISSKLAHRRLGHTSSHTTKINHIDLGYNI